MTTTAEEIRLIFLLLLIAMAVALPAQRAKLPYTLALVIVGLVIGVFNLLPGVMLTPDEVLFIFLPALLFEGAWNLDRHELARNWLPITLLAGPGLAIAVCIFGLIIHFAIGLDWSVALLLGAIISPTDPIAVLALLRQMGLATRLRILIEGESLFNDGVAASITQVLLAVVLSIVASAAASGSTAASSTASATNGGTVVLEIFLGLLRLIGGGALLGLVIGYAVSHLVRYVDDHLIETAITVLVAYGSYLLAEQLQVSGIVTIIVAALILGSYGREIGMAEHTQEAVDSFWGFAAYIANSFLFLLMGLEIRFLPLENALIGIGWAVFGVVAGRTLMISLCIPFYNFLAQRLEGTRIGPHIAPGRISRRWQLVLLSAGLRGALSLALALSLPLTVPYRSLLILMVYGVVLVTLLGQGFGLRLLLPLFRRTGQANAQYIQHTAPEHEQKEP
jgi:CPA1 family monovalent cation:H+ antiporter